MKFMRSSGIILHPTSLPGPDGIGDLGPEAYRWVNFLDETSCSLWQVLALGLALLAGRTMVKRQKGRTA